MTVQLIEATGGGRTGPHAQTSHIPSRPGWAAVFQHKDLPDAHKDPDITTKACHVLWLSEILHCGLHSGCFHVPLQGQGISSCIPCLSG